MSTVRSSGFWLLFVGRFIDTVGTKIGYAASMVIWSIAAAGHALVRTVFGFGVARFCLGLGESGNFPAAIKATAEWFPKKERAFATGLFNSGANAGAVIAPLIVPWITLTSGWREAFVFTGI
jgi:ACS family hexuronate transporter-like MFS transporter